jgi:predicted permease
MAWLDSLRLDVRHAVRSIARHPVAAAVAILSLAAGIGGTTVGLLVRDAVYRQPPPLYRQPGTLHRIEISEPDRPFPGSVPVELYRRWQAALPDGIAGAAASRVQDVRTEQRMESLPVRAVTPGLFALLGVQPVLGRTFDARDDGGLGAEMAPVVLSHPLWLQLFDGQPGALGRTIWVDGQAHTVIGILPPRFWFSDMSAPLWTALEPDSAPAGTTIDVVARRTADETGEALRARLAGVAADYVRERPADARQLQVLVSGIEGTPLGRQVAPALPYVLGVAVLLTLLIACANVAVLLFAQWTARAHEIAVRASMGAGRGRVIRGLLTESVLLAAAGGLAGLGATLAIRGLLLRDGGSHLALFNLDIRWPLFASVTAVTVAAGLGAGLLPAVCETRRIQANPLQTFARGDRVPQRWRNALVVAEIAMTIALLVQTASMVDGYRRARSGVMGFALDPLLTVHLEREGGVDVDEALALLERLPGVASAAVATAIPYAAVGADVTVSADAAGGTAVRAAQAAITPGFFETLGIPFRAGGTFAPHEDAAARRAIVNEALADRLFAGRDVIGDTIHVDGQTYAIAGVVANYATNPLRAHGEAEPRLFVPFDAAAATQIDVLIRARGEAGALLEPVRRSVRAGLPGTTVAGAFTLGQVHAIAAQELLAGAAPLFPLNAIGMLLAMAGIYGVLAFGVARRSRELALRMAIGARPADVLRLVFAQSARLIASGVALGLAAAFGVSRIVQAGGGEGSVFDPPLAAFLVPIAILAAAGCLATWIPSRRAMRVDPAILLRIT